MRPPHPDEAEMAKRFPTLARVGQQLHIPSGPFAGRPTVVRRKLTARGGVLFTLQYADGTIREWEFLD